MILDAFSYIIIVGSSFCMLPQIYQIYKEKSTENLSLLMFFLNTLTNGTNAIYNFKRGNSFMLYGETLMLTFFNYIVFLIIVLSRQSIWHFNITIFVPIAFFFILQYRIPMDIVSQVEIFASLVSFLSYIPQIYIICKNKNVGVLNFETILLFLIGSWMRLFTIVIKLSNDNIMIMSALLNFLINNALVAVHVTYSNPKEEKKTYKKNQYIRLNDQNDKNNSIEMQIFDNNDKL
jgi:uncharacterized protein with PQ loop repeat